MKVPVEISARHFHATEADYRVLFGDDEPKIVKELSQKGQFASDKEADLIIGDKKIDLRFLGPYRQMTQIEITMTDAHYLETKPPVAECVCHNKKGYCDPGVEATLRGPKGEIKKKMVIIAQRHLHINTKKATELGVCEDDLVKVAIGNERRTIFENVLCRVDDTFSFDVHLDTDEANAAGLSAADEGELIIP